MRANSTAPSTAPAGHCRLCGQRVLRPTGTHTVTPAAGSNGSITPSTPQTVNDGAQVSFTLAPDAHYRVGTVSGCGGSLSGVVYTTAPVTADCTVSATFAPITHVVSPSAGAHGSIAPATPQTVNDGATDRFTLTPDAHYRDRRGQRLRRQPRRQRPTPRLRSAPTARSARRSRRSPTSSPPAPAPTAASRRRRRRPSTTAPRPPSR